MNIGIYNPRIGMSEPGGTEAFLRAVIPYLTENHDVTVYLGDGDLVTEVLELDVERRLIDFCPKEHRANRLLSAYSPILPAEVESLSMFADAYRSGQFEQMEREMDVVSTHYYLDNLLVSRQIETPTMFRFPGIKQPSIRWRTMSWLSQTDCYLTNSEATTDRVELWLDIHPAGEVYPGIDTEQFHPDVEPAFAADNFVVLYAGRLDTGKGLEDLIDAHARLPADVELYLVGDGTLRDTLETRVEERGTGGSVTFVGAVPHDGIQRYYAAADVFCLPSHHEGFGMVNIEALACGVPVVSTRIDAIEEYITEGENGLLVEPGNVRGLAGALRQLYDSPATRAAFREKGLETVSKFSWEAQARRLEQFYRETADAGSP